MRRLLLTLCLLTALVYHSQLAAQPCDPLTPSFNINLTGNPSGSWTSPATQRYGYCCTASGSDQCVEFNIILDPNANGISFNVTCGAMPAGALFYQVNCGPQIPVGQPICLSGIGPHRITFCKPGNNANCYSITSIPQPAISGDIQVTQACTGVLSAVGLDSTTVTWSSVPPNALYNSYLNCTAGCNTVTVTPTGTPPAFIDYQVCGNVIGGCGSVSFCDTARVYFFNNLAVNITPVNPVLCAGPGNTVVVTANPSGGATPYTYSWSTGQTSQSITVGVGTYTVTLDDSMHCSTATATVNVTALPAPITANAGNDTMICANHAIANLHGVVQVATGGIWSGGTGTFSPNNTTLNATYYPSATEINNGTVTLTLTTTGNQGCPAVTDMVTITIAPPPTPVINGSALLCALTSGTYSVTQVVGSSYSWSSTNGSINGSITTSTITVSWGTPGVATVTVTETNAFGCDSTITQNISLLANPIPVITGPNSVCRLSGAAYSVAPFAGNTYNWSVTGGSINGAPTASAINVSWGNGTSGTVTMTQTNSFGCDSTISMNVTLNPFPVPLMSGPTTACRLTGSTYSVFSVPGDSYAWTVTGGSINGPSNASSINVSWGNAASGIVTVTQTNSFGCDSTITRNVTLNPYPAPAITGPNSVCRLTGSAYSVPFIAGDIYAWSVTGGSINGASNANAINVSWGNAPSGTVTVTQTNAFGCDSTVTMNVTLNPYPVPVITGSNSVCRLTGSAYSVAAVAGNSYNWSVTGGSINGVANSNSINVSWGNGTSGTVTVIQMNSFGCDSTVTMNVTLNPYPVPVITGPANVCQLSPGTYSTANVAGNTYAWSVTGGSISGSSNSSAVNISWGASTSGTVTVTQTNSFGCDSTVTRTITLMPNPTPVITGPNNLCRLTGGGYSVGAVAGNSYAWSVTGGSINGPSNGSAINVSWGNNPSGIVTLTQTNTQGCDSTVSMPVTLNPYPLPVISGATTACQLTAGTYSVFNIPSNTYAWTVTGGSINGSAFANSVTISWGNAAFGTVTVTQTNTFGCDSTVSMNVNLIMPPTPVITGSTTVCAGSSTAYSVTSASGNLFSWTVTGGSIAGSPNSSAVNIIWGTGSSGTVTVTQTNSYGCDSTVSINVNIISLPVVSIMVPQNSCLDMLSQFSVNLQPGENAVWNVTGGTFVGPNNMSTVDVGWSTGGFHNISVVVTNSSGCTTTVNANAFVELPPTPIISGPSPVCETDTAQYSVAYIPGHTYIWNVTGGSIVSFNISNTIDVQWWSAGTGTVSCKQISPAGCDSTVLKSIVINQKPVPVINGNIYVCEHTSENYYVQSNPGSNYAWTVTGGFITGNTNGSSVSVNWDVNGSATLTVVETNNSGCAQFYTMPITVQAAPVPTINGSITGCITPVTTNYSTPWTVNSSFIWTVTGGSIVSGNGSNSVNISWNTVGTNTVTLTVTNTMTGCDSTATLNVNVTAIIPPTVSASVSSGCPPLTVMFSGNNSIPGQTYMWSFGDNFASTGSNPTHIYNSSGNFTVTVVTMNANGCSDTAHGFVIVRPTPNASFTHNFINDIHYIPESTLILTNTSTGGQTYMWTFGTGDTSNAFEPPYVYHLPDDYIIHLYVTNQWGCRDSAQQGIRVRVRENIYIPNAFSPNGDNVNDYFFVDGANISNIKMVIFDRWGEILVRTEDKNFKWDGTFKGDKCQQGVYGYFVTTKGANGTENEYKGTITLVK
jgi:gliding motility-associated-like protein